MTDLLSQSTLRVFLLDDHELVRRGPAELLSGEDGIEVVGDDEEALLAAIMAGASGYVLKRVTGAVLVDGIRRVAAGQSLLDPVS